MSVLQGMFLLYAEKEIKLQIANHYQDQCSTVFLALPTCLIEIKRNVLNFSKCLFGKIIQFYIFTAVVECCNSRSLITLVNYCNLPSHELETKFKLLHSFSVWSWQ